MLPLTTRRLVNIHRLEFGTLDGIVGRVRAGIGITMLPGAVVARAETEGRVAPSISGWDQTVLSYVQCGEREGACSGIEKERWRGTLITAPASSRLSVRLAPGLFRRAGSVAC